MIRMLLGLRTPWPLPIGLPAGITLAAPAALRRRAITGVVAGVAEDVEPFGHQDFGRLQGRQRVGQEGPGIGQDFELDPVGPGFFRPESSSRPSLGRSSRRPRR